RATTTDAARALYRHLPRDRTELVACRVPGPTPRASLLRWRRDSPLPARLPDPSLRSSENQGFQRRAIPPPSRTTPPRRVAQPRPPPRRASVRWDRRPTPALPAHGREVPSPAWRLPGRRCGCRPGRVRTSDTRIPLRSLYVGKNAFHDGSTAI